MNTAARYVSLYVHPIDYDFRFRLTSLCRFLMANSYSGFVVLYTWVSNSFPRPPSKRAVAVALVNAFSQTGNIAGSYVFSALCQIASGLLAYAHPDMYGPVNGARHIATLMRFASRLRASTSRCAMSSNCTSRG